MKPSLWELLRVVDANAVEENETNRSNIVKRIFLNIRKPLFISFLLIGF
jgi:hypothetical protein